jgi:hypothetical protein
MKIRIKFANTERAVICGGLSMSYKKYVALLDFRDELRQHAQWHN